MKKIVAESLDEKYSDWYENEVAATIGAYGLDEIEIDRIFNDPDTHEMILGLFHQAIDPEEAALKVLQYADDNGIVSNEQEV